MTKNCLWKKSKPGQVHRVFGKRPFLSEFFHGPFPNKLKQLYYLFFTARIKTWYNQWLLTIREGFQKEKNGKSLVLRKHDLTKNQKTIAKLEKTFKLRSLILLFIVMRRRDLTNKKTMIKTTTMTTTMTKTHL